MVASNIEVNVLEADAQATPLFKKLQKFFNSSFRNLNAWTEALDCLVYPEHRFKYWFQIIVDMLADEVKNPPSRQRLTEVVKLLIQDVASTERPLVNG